MKKIIKLFAPAFTLAVFTTSVLADAAFQTRYGVIQNDADGFLIIGNKNIEGDVTIQNQDSLTAAFRLKNSDVLVFNMDRGSSCQNQFFIVEASKNKAVATQIDGQCGKKAVQASVENEKLTIKSENMEGKEFTYSYSNGVLSQIK